MILYKIQDSILMSPARRNRIIMANFVLSLVVNMFTWAVLIFSLYGESEYIVLGYNAYFGISALGPWYQILLMPVLGLVVGIINFTASFYLYLEEKILSYFLAFIASVFNILILVAISVLIYLNI